MKNKYLRKTIKRYVSAALIFALVMSSAACTSKKPGDSETENPVIQDTPVPTLETQPVVDEPEQGDNKESTMPTGEATAKPTDEATVNPTTEPENEENVSGIEDNTTAYWREGYIKYIENWKTGSAQSIDSFSLYDIDGNSVPELIIKPVAGPGAEEGLLLISYRDGGIVELGSYMAGDRSDIYIYPKARGFEFNGAKDAAIYIDAYVLEDYEMKPAYSYRYSNDAGASPRAFYYVGEGQASKDEFYGFMNNFKSGGTIKLSFFGMSGKNVEAAETVIMNAAYVWASPAEVSEYILPDNDTIVTSEPVEAGENIQPGNNATPMPEPAATGDYILPDSNTRLLTEADLAGLSKEQLRIARNELYARNGRRFVSADLQAYFDEKSWYNGTIQPDNFNDGMLNETEKKNLQLIQKAEQQ